jgi:hypothetical protein
MKNTFYTVFNAFRQWRSLRVLTGKVALVFLLSQHSGLLAQSAEPETHRGTHRLGLGLGHTQLSGSFQGENIQSVPLASWSLDYAYGLSSSWAIGLQFEWLLESFIVEGSDGVSLERAYPLSIIPVGLYRFNEHWSAVAGVGLEVAEGESLALTRLGVEYMWELSPQWEVGATLVWDDKWNYYNSWGLAFTVSRLWKSGLN